MSPSPTERLNAIVEQGLCIGCGLCEALAPQSITVRKTTTGFEMPVVIGELHDTTVDLIYDVCPGTRVEGLPDRLVADCLLYTSPSPRDATLSRMPSSA